MSRRYALPLALIALVPIATTSAARPQTADPVCSTNPLVAQRVRIAYPLLPSDTSMSSLVIPLLDAQLVNSSPSALAYELVGEMSAGGEHAELVLATGSLAPFSTGVVPVPLDGFGIALSNLRFSGRLSLALRVFDSAGALLDRDTAPPVFFHDTQSSSGALIQVYRREARRISFNSGDIYHTLSSSPAPADAQGLFEGGAGSGNASQDHGPRLVSAGGVPGKMAADGPMPLGNDRWQFCLRWVYDSIDSGFGEDYYTSGRLMKARGVRVEVKHPNWVGALSFHANKNTGCIEFNATENSGFIVTMWAEARLGDNDNVFVRAFPTKLAAAQNPLAPPFWQFTANPGGVPRTVYYQNEISEESNLIAIASFIFDWIDSQCSPGLPGPENLYAVSDNPDCAVGGSCQKNNYVEIAPGSTNRKFLIGHEVGHWIHYQWTSGVPGFYDHSWDGNSNDADCEFTGVGDHAMRSKEYSVGAFGEGFAHFLSAFAWNSSASTTAWFKYYKEVGDLAYADFAADNWRLDVEGIGLAPAGGVSNWMGNMCPVNDGYSVEMDWLRFYWDYLTNAGGPKPNIRKILAHVQFTRDAHPWFNTWAAYDKMLEAIGDVALGQTTLEARFIALATSNGVAQ